MVNTEIKLYVLNQYTGGVATGYMYFYDNDGKHIANAYFMRRDVLPASWQGENGFIQLYFHEAAFSPIVDMLRNEKPCYLLWCGEGVGAITTSPERVGENEFIR